MKTTCNPCTGHPAWKHQQEPEEPYYERLSLWISLGGYEEDNDKDADLVAERALGGLGVGVEDEGVRDFHLQPVYK